MRERVTDFRFPAIGVSKFAGLGSVARPLGGRSDRQWMGSEFRVPADAGHCGDPSNTFVAICAEAVISLLKTWSSTHTVRDVSVSRECRFVWQ